MIPQKPHYLLFSQSIPGDDDGSAGRWHFVLESLDGGSCIEASDEEPDIEGERLDLLAVVRGLEAIPQPASVTLVTNSQQVNRGFRTGLDEWKSNNWNWERFGRYVPVKNQDLWQRIDHALQYHQVECRTWRFDPAHLQTPVRLATQTTAARTRFRDRLKNATHMLKTWMAGQSEFKSTWPRTA